MLIKEIFILFLSLSDLARLQHIFAWKQLHKTGIKLQEFQRGDDYRILWKRINNAREKFVLLDCPSDILADVINASISFNMTGSFNVCNYIVLFKKQFYLVFLFVCRIYS